MEESDLLFEFTNDISFLILSHLEKIDAERWLAERIVENGMVSGPNQLLGAEVVNMAPIYAKWDLEQYSDKFEARGDHAIVYIKGERLVLEMALIKGFYWIAPKENFQDLFISATNGAAGLAKIANYGVENLQREIEEEMEIEIRLGEKYTLFVEKIDMYVGVPFLTKGEWRENMTSYDIQPSSIGLNVVMEFDLVDEEAYRPPKGSVGGSKYEEAKTRYEATKRGGNKL